jgi:peroxiredoxin
MTPAVPVQFNGSDGLRIVGDRWGHHTDPPVVFLHGGGQTRHSWGATAASVANKGWQALTLDARGHGESDWSDAGDYRLASFADDLRSVIGQLDQPPILVGASLGGLTSILLTGELAPRCARGVVLVDIVPDMEQIGAERIRAFMVERAYDGFGSLEEVAEIVAAYNPYRAPTSDFDGLRKNLRERDGRFYWHWDPRFMDPESGMLPVEISDTERLDAAVDRMVAEAPVMLVRGKVSDLVSEDKAAEFLARYPDVRFADVSGAGHMVAGDRNDAFTSVVIDFIGDDPRLDR